MKSIDVDSRVHQSDPATHLLFGEVGDELIRRAYELDVRLLVVGAHGRQKLVSARLGSHVDALAARAGVPLVVIRDEEPWTTWAAQQRPLRIVLGADDSETTKAAVRFLEELRSFGPCEITAVRLFWPPREFDRLGFGGTRSFLELDPPVQAALKAELAERLGGIPVQVVPHMGNVGERLASIGAKSQADLIVVGSHGRSGAARLFHGSVSRDVLHHAQSGVVCVPAPAGEAVASQGFRSAVVATDFSELGNAALTLACTAVPMAGAIHVVHVVPPRHREPSEPSDIFAREGNAGAEAADAHNKLRSLLQQFMLKAADGKELVAHVLESNKPAEAIAQAAERLRADLICLGTRGRGPISHVVLGSVAQGVLEHTTRAVLLAKAPPHE